MEILGIGMPELVFIVIIALIILGPKDMQKAGKTIGKFLRNLVTSDGWKLFQQTSRDLRTLPNRLMREANEELDQVNKELKNAAAIADLKRAYPESVGPQSQPFSATPPAKPEVNNNTPPAAKENKDAESEPRNNA